MSLSVIIGDDEKGVDRFPSLPGDKIDTEPLRSPLPPPVEKVPVLSLEPVSPFLSFYESGHLETCLSGEFPGYLETCLSGKVKGEGLEPSLLHLHFYKLPSDLHHFSLRYCIVYTVLWHK